jgi:PIN domain nuclease of toxin-antitoxin system
MATAMRVLLDTHVLLWWLLDENAVSRVARAAIADDANETLVSAASAWEIAIKYKTGKLPTAAPLMAHLEKAILDEGFAGMPVTLRHGEMAGGLPLHHKDPFDRMLIAQALTESLTLVSNERLFDRYGVTRLW